MWIVDYLIINEYHLFLSTTSWFIFTKRRLPAPTSAFSFSPAAPCPRLWTRRPLIPRRRLAASTTITAPDHRPLEGATGVKEAAAPKAVWPDSFLILCTLSSSRFAPFYWVRNRNVLRDMFSFFLFCFVCFLRSHAHMGVSFSLSFFLGLSLMFMPFLV